MVNRPDAAAGTCATQLALPKLRAIARHAVPNLVECTLVPTLIFSVVLQLSGLISASLAALGWSYAMLVRRLIMRIRIPGLLLLTCLGLTMRTAVVVASGSAFIYFVQPIAATAIVGFTFLASALTSTTMVDRLAKDFCPLTDDIVGRRGVKRHFRRLTIMWAGGEPAECVGHVLAAADPVRLGLRRDQAALGDGGDLERRCRDRAVVDARRSAGGAARRSDRAAHLASVHAPHAAAGRRPRRRVGRPSRSTGRSPDRVIVDPC